MTTKTLAEQLGISKSMTSRLVRRGMPRAVEAAKLWRTQNLEPARVKGARPNIAANAERADDGDTSPGDGAAYRRARTQREQIRAQREALELQRLRGEVIDAGEVEALQFTAGRITRDRMLMVAPRTAADLHALVLSLVPVEHRAAVAVQFEVHVVERRIENALRTALTEAERAIEDAGRDDDEPDD